MAGIDKRAILFAQPAEPYKTSSTTLPKHPAVLFIPGFRDPDFFAGSAGPAGIQRYRNHGSPAEEKKRHYSRGRHCDLWKAQPRTRLCHLQLRLFCLLCQILFRYPLPCPSQQSGQPAQRGLQACRGKTRSYARSDDDTDERSFKTEEQIHSPWKRRAVDGGLPPGRFQFRQYLLFFRSRSLY